MKPLPVCLLLLLLNWNLCYSQRERKNEIVPYSSPCILPNVQVYGSNNPPRFDGDLTSYFKNRIDKNLIKKITGVLFVQIFVDSTGQGCVKAINNNTYNDSKVILKLGLDTVIANMPTWIPKKQNTKLREHIVVLAIYFRVEGKKI